MSRARSTVCNPGSGDLCDPDDLHRHRRPSLPQRYRQLRSTVCRSGSGDSCDPDEICTGTADQPCPSDSVTASGTVCRPGSGDLCDPDETCTGVAGQTCPSDMSAFVRRTARRSLRPPTRIAPAPPGSLPERHRHPERHHLPHRFRRPL
jgi:hypothetical protein